MLENCNINQQDRYKLRVNHNLSFEHSLCAWRFGADRFAPISVIQVFKGAPNADFFASYEYFRIRQGSKWPPKKFESDDVIMGSTGVK